MLIYETKFVFQWSDHYYHSDWDSPQRADKAVHRTLRVQRHDVSDVEEAGGRVWHPAAASGASSSGEILQVEPQMGLPAPACLARRTRSPRTRVRWNQRFSTQQLQPLLGPPAGFCMKTKTRTGSQKLSRAECVQEVRVLCGLCGWRRFHAAARLGASLGEKWRLSGGENQEVRAALIRCQAASRLNSPLQGKQERSAPRARAHTRWHVHAPSASKTKTRSASPKLRVSVCFWMLRTEGRTAKFKGQAEPIKPLEPQELRAQREARWWQQHDLQVGVKPAEFQQINSRKTRLRSAGLESRSKPDRSCRRDSDVLQSEVKLSHDQIHSQILLVSDILTWQFVCFHANLQRSY